MPKVFIIILNWNGCEDTIECIESLKKIDYPDYKIVVVDNGSTDGSDEVIPKKYFETVAFIETKKNLGFAGGNNIGIIYAIEHGAEYVLLLNNDTIVESDFLGELVRAAQNNASAGILGPKIYFADDRRRVWFNGGKINWAKTRGTHIGYRIIDSPVLRKSAGTLTENSESKDVDYITGCCLLAKREVIEKIGLLEEDYFLYYEDTDWCLRATRAGFKLVLAPLSVIYHKHSKSTGELSYPYIYYHSRNGLMLASRFGSKIIAYLLSFWIFAKQVVKLLLGYKREWARPVMRGVVDFWKGKRGKLEGYY